jgi:hypothetical protein
LFFSYYIQHCFICRPSDSTVPTDAGIEPKIGAYRDYLTNTGDNAKKIFDQAIIGGDTIFPLSLRLSGIELSLV